MESRASSSAVIKDFLADLDSKEFKPRWSRTQLSQTED